MRYQKSPIFSNCFILRFSKAICFSFFFLLLMKVSLKIKKALESYLWFCKQGKYFLCDKNALLILVQPRVKVNPAIFKHRAIMVFSKSSYGTWKTWNSGLKLGKFLFKAWDSLKNMGISEETWESLNFKFLAHPNQID